MRASVTPGQRERQHDQDPECLQERTDLDDVRQLRAHEQPQQVRQSQHLGQHQQRARGDQALIVAASEPGEHDHLIDARGEQTSGTTAMFKISAETRNRVPRNEPANFVNGT